MGLKRVFERKSLKKEVKNMESIIRDGGMANAKLHMEMKHQQKKIADLMTELKVAKDIITAMAINDIRNHNFTSEKDTPSKKKVSIPYTFLVQVTNNYTLDVKHYDDAIVIEPMDVKKESGSEEPMGDAE